MNELLLQCEMSRNTMDVSFEHLVKMVYVDKIKVEDYTNDQTNDFTQDDMFDFILGFIKNMPLKQIILFNKTIIINVKQLNFLLMWYDGVWVSPESDSPVPLSLTKIVNGQTMDITFSKLSVGTQNYIKNKTITMLRVDINPSDNPSLLSMIKQQLKLL